MMVAIETMIYTLYGWAFLATVGLGMVLTTTPAGKFLAARFSKSKALIAVISRGNRIDFVLGDVLAGGFTTKKNGMYDETAGSMYITQRTPIYLAYEGYAHTQKIDYNLLVKKLRKQGHQVNTFADFKKILEEPKKRIAELSTMIVDKSYESNWPDLKKELSALKKDYQELLSGELEIRPGQTITYADMAQMWPAIDDPHLREKEKAAEVTLSRMNQQVDAKKWFVILLIGGVVVYILWSLFQNGNTEPISVTCQYPDLIQGVASNFTI